MEWINGVIFNHPSSTLTSDGLPLAHVYRVWNTWAAMRNDGALIGYYGTKTEAQRACEE